jgi:hypothetical protein
MELERKNICPLLKKKCIGLDCAWFMKLEGTNPQDPDKRIDEWGCAVPWLVMTTLQTAKDVRQGTHGVQVATEIFRNEMIDANRATGEKLVNRVGANVLARLVKP